MNYGMTISPATKAGASRYNLSATILVKLVRLQLHSAIYRPNSFVMKLRYCENLKAIRCESTSLNRIVADKSHLVIVALLVTRCNSLTTILFKIVHSYLIALKFTL